MQPLAVLFAIFVLAFVAGIGWYTGRGVVQFVAGIVARGGTQSTAKPAKLPAQSEKKTLTVFE
jgi:hypothetical protein